MFFGRGREVRSALRHFSRSKSVLLCAQRRAGKTSLAWQLKKNAAIQQGYRPVLLDLTGAQTDTEENLLWRIHCLLLETELPHPQNAEQAADQLAQTIQVSFQQTGKVLLLILDEFDAVFAAQNRGAFDESFFARLNTWAQTLPVIFLIICSVQFEQQAGNSFPKFARLSLRALTVRTARLLITQPANGLLYYEEQAIETILKLSRCYPYYIQTLCSQLYGIAQETLQNFITVEMVQRAQQGLPESCFAHLWDHQNDDHPRLLAQLSKLSVDNQWVSAEQLPFPTSTINALCNLETIEQQDEQQYRIYLPLFQQWILFHWSYS